MERKHVLNKVILFGKNKDCGEYPVWPISSSEFFGGLTLFYVKYFFTLI